MRLIRRVGQNQSMTIPGLKVLDEIIAGLPTNSAQRLELAKLRAEVELKDRKIAELESQIANLKPEHGLQVDTIKVLKLFFEAGRELSPRQVSQHLQMSQSIIDYHFDTLIEAQFIRQTKAAFMDAKSGGYSIEPKGRSFVIKNGLI